MRPVMSAGDDATAPTVAAVAAAVVGCAVPVLAALLAGAPAAVVGLVGLVPTVVLGTLAHRRQRRLADLNRRLLARLDQESAQARRIRDTDHLTGLPDRAGFLGLVAAWLADEHPDQGSVIAIRPTQAGLLEHLTAPEADAVVAELAERITWCLRPDERLARTGDAAFAVLTHVVGADALDRAGQLVAAVEEPVRVPNHQLRLALAAGIGSVSTAGGSFGSVTAAHLLQQAVIALGTVATRPSGVAVFTPWMRLEHEAQLGRREAVVRALRSDPGAGIEVVFEPVVELASGRMVGVAASADWRDGEHTTLPVGHLTTIAREAGLAWRVDDVVLRAAVGAFGTWYARWPQVCRRLWVTVCAETIADSDPGLLDCLPGLLRAAGLPDGVLVLDPLDARKSATGGADLGRLRAAGAQVVTRHALVLADDGADRSFDELATADYYDIAPVLVDRCVEDSRARRLIRAITELAVARGASSTAREVANAGQHQVLYQLGAAVARGPLYGVPLRRDGIQAVILAAASGGWQAPVPVDSQRHRSSLA